MRPLPLLLSDPSQAPADHLTRPALQPTCGRARKNFTAWQRTVKAFASVPADSHTQKQTPTAGSCGSVPGAWPSPMSAEEGPAGHGRLLQEEHGHSVSLLREAPVPLTPALPWCPLFPGAGMFSCHPRPKSYPSFRAPPAGSPPGSGISLVLAVGWGSLEVG